MVLLLKTNILKTGYVNQLKVRKYLTEYLHKCRFDKRIRKLLFYVVRCVKVRAKRTRLLRGTVMLNELKHRSIEGKVVLFSAKFLSVASVPVLPILPVFRASEQ